MMILDALFVLAQQAPSSGDPTALQVAIVGVIGVISVAIISSIPAWFSRKASNNLSENITEKVGIPNGRGNVIELLHKILDVQSKTGERLSHQDERIAKLEERAIDNTAEIGVLKGRLDAMEKFGQPKVVKLNES